VTRRVIRPRITNAKLCAVESTIVGLVQHDKYPTTCCSLRFVPALVPAPSLVLLTFYLLVGSRAMALQAAYGGPTALGHSKYASPSMRRAQLAAFPATVSSTKNTTIATKEQIAASHDESAVDAAAQNLDAELAIAQGNALKEDVDKHAAQFCRTVSSAVTNTRQLLELIREAVHKDDPTALQPVDDLWQELELLFKAVQGTKEALPAFLEKQRNNMALYHASVMNETYRESQQELNIQHKKVSHEPASWLPSRY
jgi:hypothetical protein